MGTVTDTRSGKKNGDGYVYHRSDCGYPFVRRYGCGGDCLMSVCGIHLFENVNLTGKYTTSNFAVPQCKGFPGVNYMPDYCDNMNKDILYNQECIRYQKERAPKGLTFSDIIWYFDVESKAKNFGDVIEETNKNKLDSFRSSFKEFKAKSNKNWTESELWSIYRLVNKSDDLFTCNNGVANCNKNSISAEFCNNTCWPGNDNEECVDEGDSVIQ
jgi:hypothetical protein